VIVVGLGVLAGTGLAETKGRLLAVHDEKREPVLDRRCVVEVELFHGNTSALEFLDCVLAPPRVLESKVAVGVDDLLTVGVTGR
jgi:hypothetical protein